MFGMSNKEVTAIAQTHTARPKKIDLLGLGNVAMELYASGMSTYQISKALTMKLKEEGTSHSIGQGAVIRWATDLPEELVTKVKALKRQLLLTQMDEWEAQALDVRRESLEQIEGLIEKELETGVVNARTKGGQTYQREMSLKEKKDLANIISKKNIIQESGEKFMGIGTKDGQRNAVHVNVQVDFVTDIKAHLKQRQKDGSIVVEAEEIDDDEEP